VGPGAKAVNPHKKKRRRRFAADPAIDAEEGSMTFTQFFHSASTVISKGVPTMKGCRSAVAVCIAGLLAVVSPLQAFAETPIALDMSIKIGPLATQLNMTQPVAQPVTTATGGSAVVYRGTLHIHVQNDTLTPAFNGDLVSTGEAADPDTLVGGFLPATICVKQDLLAGMTFPQAAADAQAKTGVTVTFFEDATIAEYSVMLAMIILVCITPIVSANVAPTLNDQACTIQSKLAAGMAAIGIVIPPVTCGTVIP
jgi:hypothetical protein